MPHDEDTHRRSYPLSILFVLIAACAVVTGLVTPAVRAVSTGTVGGLEAVAASLTGGLSMSVMGAIVGMYHYRQLRGVGWGLLTGACLGLVLGPVSLAPHSAVGSIISLSMGGSLLLVAVGAFFRFASPEPDDDENRGKRQGLDN